VTSKRRAPASRAELLARLQACEAALAAAAKPAGAALQDSEARLRAILDTAVEGIITIDERGIIQSLNPAAGRLFQYSAPELVGKNVNTLMPAPYHGEHDGYLARYRKTAQARIIGIGREVSGRRKDGTTFPMELSVTELKLAKDRQFVGFVRDISARKESEQRMLAALRELTDIKAALDEHSIVAVTDARGRITHVNDKFCAISKYPRKELLGQDHRIINSGYHPQSFFRDLWTTIARGRIWRGEIRNRAKDGTFYWVDTTIFPFLGEHGKPVQYIAIRTDITERKLHEEQLVQLAEVQAALSASEREVLAVTERERVRFGSELHDGLGQQLTAIELMCQSLKDDLKASQTPVQNQISQICQHLREAIGQTRSLARGLAPVLFDTNGLAEALEELARRTHALGRLRCKFVCPAPVPLADSTLAGHFYRVAQEAVTNALKHSSAKAITIRLTRPGGKVRLEITDDGRGFSTRKKRGEGIGLQMLSHRARVMDADLTVVSQPGKGTKITCISRIAQP
jgi:two-component system sensor histidine kinase NreB